MAIGILCLAYLSVRIARNELFTAKGYEIEAVFSNCSGLRNGSPVRIAGVEVGRVEKISLQDYEAKTILRIHRDVVLQKDAIASIKTAGMIGEKYIEITPGGSDQKIDPGGRLRETQPAMDIEALISKYVQGNLSTPATTQK